jgi:hypothetical protein
MSADPLDRLRQLREQCDRAFDPADVEAHHASASPEAENLALRLAVHAQQQMAQARRLSRSFAQAAGPAARPKLGSDACSTREKERAQTLGAPMAGGGKGDPPHTEGLKELSALS